MVTIELKNLDNPVTMTLDEFVSVKGENVDVNITKDEVLCINTFMRGDERVYDLLYEYKDGFTILSMIGPDNKDVIAWCNTNDIPLEDKEYTDENPLKHNYGCVKYISTTPGEVTKKWWQFWK